MRVYRSASAAIPSLLIFVLAACESQVAEPDISGPAYSRGGPPSSLAGVPHGWIVSSRSLLEDFVTGQAKHSPIEASVWHEDMPRPDNAYFVIHDVLRYNYLRLVQPDGPGTGIWLEFSLEADATLTFSYWLGPGEPIREGTHRGTFHFGGNTALPAIPGDLKGARGFRDWLDAALQLYGVAFFRIFGSTPTLEELLAL
jgi:hypothetical protein